ncbi:Peptidoglycan/xylan/chitin deacetylase, PgdA/CDA1 family [Lacicoccus qingdaonensis]|uniref:Peptidoglycan/xylan/chitin deacetylase, PgdA/CDA1 family n=2 Tax=Lacicoccus qingdaonensis TaxID=576118 RepID=A0A1G9E4R6_9BACL|nr:Peptidoglycan/xylan/chitin deacetylase, PgdA/CDA1 family [Salinicoccus qingdaonensis]
MTATFFASPEQLEMYPEGTKEILDRGHMIENNAMYGMDVDALQHEDIYQRVETTNEMVETATGDSAEFAFVKNNDNKDLNAIVAQLDMTGIVTPVSELKPSDDEDKMLKNIKRAVARGGILSMDPDDASLIPYLKEAADEVDFEFIPLENLIAADETRKDFSEIKGADAIQPNEDMTDVVPHLHYQQPTTEKEVALTFDDWASETIVQEVLDILDEYEIQSTFYLKSEKIEENPNLARLLIERGHEVANHTHSHPDTTTLTPEELQEDVYQAHQIITEAIQEQPTLYFRPPFGRIEDQASHAITAMGYEAIGMYDISSYDWNDEYTEADVINRVMTIIQPGSVIVMHILDDIHTPSVLDDVIESIQAEGYEFVLTSDWLDE